MGDNAMQKGIIRGARGKLNPYFQHARAAAQDRRLSYEARGVHTYLLSKPDDWSIYVSDLADDKCGRDRVYRILKELMQYGYVRRHQQSRDDKGRMSRAEYVVYEIPEDCDEGEPQPPKAPCPEKPYADNPYTENPTLHIRDIDREENIQNHIAPSGADDVLPAIINVSAYKKTGLPEAAIYIGREYKRGSYDLAKSKWANPYHLKRGAPDDERAEVIARYREHILAKPDLLRALPELRGKTLACWCAPCACHGDVLHELAALPDDEIARLANDAQAKLDAQRAEAKAARVAATTPATTINPVKDALHAAWNYPRDEQGNADWKRMGGAEKGVIQKIAKEIIDAGGTPAHVPYLKKWLDNQGWTNPTLAAISKHLSVAMQYATTELARATSRATSQTPTATPAHTNAPQDLIDGQPIHLAAAALIRYRNADAPTRARLSAQLEKYERWANEMRKRGYEAYPSDWRAGDVAEVTL